MSHYLVTVPFQPSMGSIQPFIVSESTMETKEEYALWEINQMREHDGLTPLKRLPKGTKFEISPAKDRRDFNITSLPCQTITMREFDEPDFEQAEKMAKRLGYTQTAYTTSSALWGLFCLRDRASQKAGCIIKTQEFGLMFVQDREDLNIA